MKIIRLLTGTLLVLIAACDPGQPAGSEDFRASGYASSLSQSEFNSLTPEQQYQVANKLMGTMFRGVSAEAFFDISAGTTDLQLQPSAATFLVDTRKALTTDAGVQIITAVDSEIDGLDAEGNPTLPSKYIFDTSTNVENNDRPRQLPLARIKEYPISREFFTQWMAYFLANTIMFSPAEEMETADFGDVQSMYSFLTTNLAENNSVRNIVRANLPTLARWRVSRSPENHALEAYELYLGLFETEVDSYRGGIACKDFYLTPENQGYLLRTTSFPNTVPQLILDTYYVTTCSDLYDSVAGHPLLMPRATEVIVNYLMAGRSLEDRLSMISSITSSGAETFEDIFLSIIFSREYLLNTERPKSFEENLMSLLDSLKWSPVLFPVDEGIFARMASDSNSRLHMDGMGWNSMSLKIGRLPDVPLDGLSFANYHKALREEILMEPRSYEGGRTLNNGKVTSGLFYNKSAAVRINITGLTAGEFIDFLFLSALQRKPMAVEVNDLLALVPVSYMTTAATGEVTINDKRQDEIAALVFDYISRLPELYYFRAVN